MPIRVPRTTLAVSPQEPTTAQSAQRVVPVQMLSNPAAAPADMAQNAAGLAAKIYQEERDREIRTRVLELDIQRRKADADVVGGYQSMLGKDAVDGRAAALAAIQANSKGTREGIKDRAVADVWKTQDAALTNAAVDQVDDHYRRQNIKWQADTLEKRADLLTSDLERVAFGEGADLATGRLSREAERNRSGYIDSINQLGSVLGWSKEEVESARRDADTKAYGQVAESLIRADRFDEASKVLEVHGDKIDVGPRDRLAELARDGKAKLLAQNRTRLVADKAQQFTLQVADLAVKHGATVSDQRAWALSTAEHSYRGGKLTTEEYDATLQRLDRHYDIRDRQEAAAQKQTVIDAERFLNENPLATLADRPKLFEDAKRSGHLPALLEFQSSKRYSTNPAKLAEVRAIPDEDLQRIAPDRLWVTLRPYLSNQDLDDVMTRHARARGEATADQLHDFSIKERVEATARSLGILPADPRVHMSAAQQKAFDDWRLRLSGDLKTLQTRLGKKPGVDDVQGLLNLQAKDYVERTTWGYGMLGLFPDFNPTIDRVPLSALPDRAQASVVVGGERIQLSRVSERNWAAIAGFLAEKGVEPTAANIVDRWVAIGRPGDTSPPAAAPAAAAATNGGPPGAEMTTEQVIDRMHRRAAAAWLGPSAGGR